MINGTNTRLSTPFVGNAVDLNRVSQLVEWQLSCGINGFVLFDRGGEGSLLSTAERTAIMATVVEKTRGQSTVGIDCTSCSPIETIALAGEASASGANYIIVSPPPSILPGQAGLMEFYLQVANESPLPVAICNDPARSGVELAHETVVNIGEQENVHAYIENSTNASRALTIGEQLNTKLPIVAGNDLMAPQMQFLGAQAFIGTGTMFAPEPWTRFFSLATSGKPGEALEIIKSIAGLIEVLGPAPSAGTVKAGLALRGLCQAEVRPPVSWPDRPTMYRLAAEMEKAGIRIQTGELS